MLDKVCKVVFITFSILVFVSSQLYAEDSPNLETNKQKESYSIGYQVGLSMKSDGVEVDFDLLIKGLQDAITDRKPLLSTEEMRDLIIARKEKAREDMLRKTQEIRVKNAEESVKFLEENAQKEGVKTTESGLQYRILQEGDGVSPEENDFVTVHYRGSFVDGMEFDNSYARGEPQRFQTNGVIRGWTEALQMMKVGSKWEIYVPPDLAYGRGGFGQTIPPNKVLVFEMELISIDKNKEEIKD